MRIFAMKASSVHEKDLEGLGHVPEKNLDNFKNKKGKRDNQNLIFLVLEMSKSKIFVFLLTTLA